MKTTLLVVGVLSAIAGAAYAQQVNPGASAAPQAAVQAPTGAQPVIDIAEKIKDFGVVAKGEKLKAVFEVRNTGKAPLEISQVRPTCGCTVASFDKTIPPGGAGKVNAEVDTQSFSGPISKAIMVFSNDTTSPQVNLVVKAEVKSFIEVLPRPLIMFRSVLQGEPATEKLTLVSADGSDFKITSVDAGGAFDVKFRELTDKERLPERKGSQWEVTATVAATAPVGMLQGKVLVKTTAPKAPEVTITVSGVVRPIIQVVPAEVNFGRVSGEALVGQNVLVLNNRQGSELKIAEATVDNPVFSTEIVPLQPGLRFQIAVSLKAGTPKNTYKATLKIQTNDPSRKVIEVPVQAIVQ